jgi:putative hydrolase of the HAD superfamily
MMDKGHSLEILAFDLDDTLWQNEIYYREAKDIFASQLSEYLPEAEAKERLDALEVDNIRLYGYGIKSFTLSMVEAALLCSDGQISGRELAIVLEAGKAMLAQEVELFEGTEAVLRELSTEYDLMMVTKGDLVEQQHKIERSGIADYFQHIEVVSEKTPDTYRKLLERHGILPEVFMMVGNSLRSDVLPVAEIGGHAVHIPDPRPWFHELPSDDLISDNEYVELEHLGQLPAYLRDRRQPSS